MATKQIAWQTGSGNITLTYQGQGDGPISVQSDANDGNARSQTIIIQTTKGGLITKNVTVSQAACPIPVGTVLNYSYTGNYQEVTLPAGQYKLQCWGAQGGSNAAASSYGIFAVNGGKGGYSEGIITLAQTTVFKVYVGGQGSSSAGGFNGGGNTSGSSTYNNDNYQGVSRMAGGGGATDIRLSDGALLSRMIVAGGGGGGACSYYKKTTTVTTWEAYTESTTSQKDWKYGNDYISEYAYSGWSVGDYIRIKVSNKIANGSVQLYIYDKQIVRNLSTSSYTYVTIPSGTTSLFIQVFDSTGYKRDVVTIEKQVQTSSTVESVDPGGGIPGGGTNGGGQQGGTQTSAGTGGSFGQGANQTVTNYRFASGAGGGGWYGGGRSYSDSDVLQNQYNGGGSGFVNTAASAGNRPSGYTGLQLDSGETKAGYTSFPAPSGGNETGHSGNGYARITRLA